jgi:hypothetical protein
MQCICLLADGLVVAAGKLLYGFSYVGYCERIAVRECLLSFGAESFVFQFAIQKYKD